MNSHSGKETATAPLPFGPFASRIAVGLTVAALFALVAFLIFRAMDLLLLIFAGYLLAVFLRWGGSQVERLIPAHPKLALVAAIVVFFLLISLFFVFLAPAVKQQSMNLAKEIPAYTVKLKMYLLRQSWGDEVLQKTDNPGELLDGNQGAVPEFLKRVVGIFSTTFGALLNIVFVLVVGIYLAFQPAVYVSGLLRLIPPARRDRAREIIHQMAETTRGWLLGQAFSMTVLGIVVGTGLWLLGVPNAIVLGLLAAVMTFIPNLGPALAFIPAILVALSRGPMTAVYVAMFYVVVQTVEGNFLTPMVQQRVASVPAALILSAQVLLFDLMGFLGIVLAMPLLACVMVLVQMVYVEDFLGDRMAEPLRTEAEENSGNEKESAE